MGISAGDIYWVAVCYPYLFLSLPISSYHIPSLPIKKTTPRVVLAVHSLGDSICGWPHAGHHVTYIILLFGLAIFACSHNLGLACGDKAIHDGGTCGITGDVERGADHIKYAVKGVEQG